jgi:hypothetical protein
VVPSINNAISAIQSILAADIHVAMDALEKLKRPVWMPHLSSLFAKSVPNPLFATEEEHEMATAVDHFSIERLRNEREAQNIEHMEIKARAKAEEEKEHALKVDERTKQELMARREEAQYLQQQRQATSASSASTKNLVPPNHDRPIRPSRRPAPKIEAKKAIKKEDSDGWTSLKRGQKPGALKALPVVAASEIVKPSAWVQKKPSKPPKPPSDYGLKIFIAGVKFDDLVEKATKENWATTKVDAIKSQRIAELKKIVSNFGAIDKWQEAWDDGYAFATFVSKEDAARAVKTLSSFDHRKGLCKQSRARLLVEGRDKVSVPSHSFYVRWPKFYQRIVTKNKAIKEEEKRKNKEVAAAETSAAAS